MQLLRNRNEAANTRLLAEARIIARCRRENIVVIHDIDKIGGSPYMVFEYVDGKSFRQVIQEESRSVR